MKGLHFQVYTYLRKYYSSMPVTSPVTLDSQHSAAPQRRAGRLDLLFTGLLFMGLCIIGQPSQAQSQAPIWQINGYATLGAAWSDNLNANYIPDALNQQGPGRGRPWDPGLDTRLALQISADPAPRVSAVLQVVTEKQFDGDFKPAVEWANLRYSVTPALSVSAGRIVLDTFLMSEHRKVGYTLPWVRPPAELYQLVSITRSDGVDVRYQTSFRNMNYALTLNYGRNELSELDGYLEAPNLWGISQRLERGALTLKATYTSYKLVYGQLDQLWDGFRAFGPAGEAVVARYTSSRRRSVFTAVAAEYDPGPWFAIAEWGRSSIRSDFGARSAWYLSAGQRHGAWTPYFTVARANGGHSTVQGIDPASFPPPLQTSITTLNELLDMAQDMLAPRQFTFSAGTRLEVSDSISAKLQLDHVSPKRGSGGTFNNHNSATNTDSSNIVSVSLDMVF